MKKLIIFLLPFLVSSCDMSYTIEEANTVSILNGSKVVPFNKNFMMVEADTGELVFTIAKSDECNVKLHKGYLTIYNIDSSSGSRSYSKYYHFYLVNRDNTQFYHIGAGIGYGNDTALKNKLSSLKVKDEIYCIYGDKAKSNIKLIN